MRICGLGEPALDGALGTLMEAASLQPEEKDEQGTETEKQERRRLRKARVRLPEVPALSSTGGAKSGRIRELPLEHLQFGDPECGVGLYPTHTDSSLVTVGPVAEIAGLEVKDLRTGRWFILNC